MWIALIADGTRSSSFGPFTTEADAHRFAAYLTAEVDPATVLKLMDPVTELLNWRDHVKSAPAEELLF